jgi:hypothetical protein
VTRWAAGTITNADISLDDTDDDATIDMEEVTLQVTLDLNADSDNDLDVPPRIRSLGKSVTLDNLYYILT